MGAGTVTRPAGANIFIATDRPLGRWAWAKPSATPPTLGVRALDDIDRH